MRLRETESPRMLLLTSVDDTRDSITNFQGKLRILSWPNPDDFARVICSTDCPDIYAKGNDRGVTACRWDVRVN